MTYRTRTGAASVGEAQDALVVHCSDARYQPLFQEFLRDGLGLPRYALVAVPGGPQVLTLTEYLPKFSWAGWRWLKFLMGLGRPSRVILIAHDDCRWYLQQQFASADRLHQCQAEDLGRVKSALTERFGPLPIECWFARMEDGQAVFEPT